MAAYDIAQGTSGQAQLVFQIWDETSVCPPDSITFTPSHSGLAISDTGIVTVPWDTPTGPYHCVIEDDCQPSGNPASPVVYHYRVYAFYVTPGSSSSGSGPSSSSNSSSTSSSSSQPSPSSSNSSESSSSSGSSSSSSSSSSITSSGSSSPTCYTPPEPSLVSGEPTETKFYIQAPPSLPPDTTLTLQVKMDGETAFKDQTSGVVASQVVTVENLESDHWYAVRWIVDD